MYIGASYYPEFFPKERWDVDATLMQQLGFNAVRMAEFAWCRLEPTEGDYQFEWLDEVIAIFAARGIQTVLGTPTGAPPHWLYEQHPDILPVEETGYRAQVGSFGVACQTAPAYLTHCDKIVREMAKHYRDNPHVIFYQIDNELPTMNCYCAHCLNAFQHYMQEQHGTIAAYNEHLMTIFQGRELSSFSQVFLPTKSRKPAPPALVSEYRKFVSHNSIAFCKMQVDAIRSVDGTTPITTNYDSQIQGFDHFEMAKLLDCVAMDSYPKAKSLTDLEQGSLDLDFSRSTGKDKENYWVLEQQCSPVAFVAQNAPQMPGESLMYTLNSLAHGAEHIMYFRFNVTHSGAERFGAGILRHDQQPGRTYYEMAEVMKTVQKIQPMLKDSKVQSERIAIVYSNRSRWMIHTPKAPWKDLSYDKEMNRFYHYCYTHNLPVDFVTHGEDLSNYRVVLAPMLASVTGEDARWLENFVEQGGVLLCGVFSGIYDEYNRISMNYYQGELRNLLGIKVQEWYMPYIETQKVVAYHETYYASNRLNMLMESEGAEVLATYCTDFYADTPAITRNAFGKGYAYYLGVLGNETLLSDLLSAILTEHDAVPSCAVKGEDDGIVIVQREHEQRDLIFVFNPTPQSHTVHLIEPLYNVKTDVIVKGDLLVAPQESIVFCKQK